MKVRMAGLIAGLALLLSGCADSGISETAAQLTLHGAAQSMQALTSFQYAGTIVAKSQTVQVSGEFSSPSNVHELVQVGPVANDFLFVGKATYRRSGTSGAWQAAAAQAKPADPRAAFSALALASQVTGSGDMYAFALTGTDAQSLIGGAASVTGTVRLQGGHMLQLKYSSDAPAVTITLNYSDFNSNAVAVTAPA